MTLLILFFRVPIFAGDSVGVFKVAQLPIAFFQLPAARLAALFRFQKCRKGLTVVFFAQTRQTGKVFRIRRRRFYRSQQCQRPVLVSRFNLPLRPQQELTVQARQHLVLPALAQIPPQAVPAGQ